MPTIRRQIIDLLSQRKYGARDLSQALSVREKEIYAHLPHVARSVISKKQCLQIIPPRCISCGYIFKTRKRFTRPSRCPRCKDERIKEPRYQIL